MAVSRERLLTVKEFEEYIARPENRRRLFELINGEIVEKMPTQEHGVICQNISAPIWIYSRDHGVGRVAQEVRHSLETDDKNARLPEVSYYMDASKPIVTWGATPYLPDLAVEVKSPDDSYKELRDKANYYLANGTRIVWLVYPEKHTVEVLTLDDFDYIDENGTLDGDDVLPGFKLAVKDIFPKK